MNLIYIKNDYIYQMKKIVLSFFAFAVVHTIQSQDTFSIVAVDENTGEVGSAGASCINGSIIISDIVPNVGAVHTQSFWNGTNQDYAHQLMVNGHSPQEIIDSLVAHDADNDPTDRQYGVVDLNGGTPRTAAYTGVNCFDEKFHRTGLNYSIQGNILIDSSVVDSIEARFLAASGDLATRLMAALQGANIPGADSRCLNQGKSSLSSFIRVAKPTDTDCFFLDINVNSTPAGIEPIDSLQHLFDNLKNNCSGFNPEIFLNRDTIDFVYLQGRLSVSVGNTQAGCAQWSISDGASYSDISFVHTFTQTGTYNVTMIASNYGCTDTLTSQVVVVNDLLVPDAVKELGKGKPFAISPNPGHREISISLYEHHNIRSIEVYSIDGKRIYDTFITPELRSVVFDSRYRKGTFVVKVITDHRIYSERVVVL